jgi:hypothetical protein
VADSLSEDLNGDGKIECIVLNNETVDITDCEKMTLWQNPAEWHVKQAFISDLNHDGKPEVTLLVWRPFQAWPIDRFLPSGGRINTFHDRQDQSCHLILIGWDGHGYNELWAGSALIRPVSQLKAADLNGDGWQELVALEGEYNGNQSGGTLTVWNWHGFGFVLLAEVKREFTQLKVMQNSEKTWVDAQ